MENANDFQTLIQFTPAPAKQVAGRLTRHRQLSKQPMTLLILRAGTAGIAQGEGTQIVLPDLGETPWNQENHERCRNDLICPAAALRPAHY